MNIFLAQPSQGAVVSDAVRTACTASRSLYSLCVRSFSILTLNFNSLWCEALNRRKSDGFTHFAMLHADIEAPPFWLDILAAELQEHNASVMAAIPAIKGIEGVTSTAIPQSPDDRWRVLKRLTVHELLNHVPPTFDAAMIGYPGRALLINTGCWICRIDEPWVEDCENIYFDTKNRITRNAEGKFIPQVESEDWFFARQLHAKGVKVMATRKVSIRHHGTFAWSNSEDWGLCQHDPTGLEYGE